MSIYNGKPLGTYCDFASYSFFQASKHITCGEGGTLQQIPEATRCCRRFTSLGYSTVNAKKGKITKEEVQSPYFSRRHVSLGFNFRMSELNAAALLGQLDHWEELIEQRDQRLPEFMTM